MNTIMKKKRIAAVEARWCERRCWHRRPIAVPVHVSMGAGGQWEALSPIQGDTADLSPGGAYIITDDRAVTAVGDLVKVSIGISPQLRHLVPFARLSGPCRVVRVDELSSGESRCRRGLALAFCQEAMTMLVGVLEQEPTKSRQPRSRVTVCTDKGNLS